MCHRVSRLRSDQGNSVLEFVVFFAAGLFLIFALSSNFESDLRSRMAALSMANDALRVWQISGELHAAKSAAAQTALAFLFDQDEWTISFDENCTSGNFQKVESRVGQVIEVAQGAC